MHRIKSFFGQSKQDIGKNEPPVQEAQAQEGADAAEPSADIASVHTPFLVSPNHAKEIMSDLPDRSAEDPVSILNEMALQEISPEPLVSGKRKRQQADVVEGPPKKRAAKGSEATGNGDDLPATSTNGVINLEGSPNRASSEAVQVAPKKLGRPKKEQPKQPVVQIESAAEKRGDVYEFRGSPKEQVENPPPTPTTTTKIIPNADTTPRGRGRPKKMTSLEEGQSKQPPEGGVSSKTRQDHQPTKSSMQKPGPKSRSKASRASLEDDPKERTRSSRSTRSTTAADRSKDAVPNTDTKEIVLSARDGENRAQARAKKASNEVRGDKSGDEEVSPSLQNPAVENSTQTIEGEGEGAELGEDDSDDEDFVQTNESEEEENGEEELELFGQDEAWKIVLDGAHSICGPKLPLNKMPKLLTKRMRDLIYEVSQARSLYEQLLPFRGLNHDSLNGINDDLRETLDVIESQIDGLSERNAAGEGKELIRDIFARAVPAMVLLLRSALASRVYHSNEPCDLKTLNEIVSGLREIIGLQKMAILLCEKAKDWKAEPVSTSKPIKAPTTRKIFPHLRDMKKGFSKVLLEQDRKRKTKQNAVDYKLRQQERAASSQQASQEAARKDEIWHRKIRESREREDERRRNEKRSFRQIREAEARAQMGADRVDGPVESRTTWCDAEDLALYFELEKGYAGQLTCTFYAKSPATSWLSANHSCSCGTLLKHTEYASLAEQASGAYTRAGIVF